MIFSIVFYYLGLIIAIEIINAAPAEPSESDDMLPIYQSERKWTIPDSVGFRGYRGLPEFQYLPDMNSYDSIQHDPFHPDD